LNEHIGPTTLSACTHVFGVCAQFLGRGPPFDTMNGAEAPDSGTVQHPASAGAALFLHPGGTDTAPPVSAGTADTVLMTIPLGMRVRPEASPASLRPSLATQSPRSLAGAEYRSTTSLPVPTIVGLPTSHAPSAWSYDIAVVDGSGRFFPRDALDWLTGWRAGAAVLLRLIDGRIVATQSTARTQPAGARRVSIDSRQRLRLPAAMRHWISVDAGDRVLIATDRSTATVIISSTAALDAMALNNVTAGA